MDKLLKYNLLGVLKFFSFILFVIGLIMNYDGFEIIFNSKKYQKGILAVDSLFGGKGPEDRNSTYYASGEINTIQTSVIVGLAGTKYVDSVIEQSGKYTVILPVWYKSDGRLTLERNAHEKTFPFWRVLQKIILIFCCFNVPSITFWLLQLDIKAPYLILGRR